MNEYILVLFCFISGAVTGGLLINRYWIKTIHLWEKTGKIKWKDE